MPKSRNRKNHKQKVEAWKQRRRAKYNKIQRQIVEQQIKNDDESTTQDND